MSNEVKYHELKARLSIDIMRIDEELMQQPMLLQDAVEFASGAQTLRDEAKFSHDRAEAAAANRLRIPAEGEKPPAESKVASQLPLQKSVREAMELLIQYNNDVRVWQGLVDALREKGSALRRISEMIIAGYLTPDSVRREERVRNRRSD